MPAKYALLTTLLFCCLAACVSVPAWAQAYCYIRDVGFDKMSNGVQIRVKADGIITWNWESGSEAAGGGAEMSQVSVRFPAMRIGVEKTFYDINVDPVGTASLDVPQNAQNGLGVDLSVVMTESASVSASLSEDRQTFLLTVNSKLTVENTGREGAVGAAKAGAYEVVEANGLVSVKAVKADIHKVVAEIAQKCGINIAVDDAVKHAISLNVTARKPARGDQRYRGRLWAGALRSGRCLHAQ